MSKQFYFKQFSLAYVRNSFVLFDSSIKLCQMLQFRVRVDLGVMIIKEYISFPKAAALLELHNQIVYSPIKTLIAGSYSSAEKKSVNSAALAGGPWNVCIEKWKLYTLKIENLRQKIWKPNRSQCLWYNCKK